MKIHASALFNFLFVVCLFQLSGCATPNLDMPERLPPIIRDYKFISYHGNTPNMIDTGIYLHEGDTYSILATGGINLGPKGGISTNVIRAEGYRRFMLKIGDGGVDYPLWGENGITTSTYFSGKLYLGLRDGWVDYFGKPSRPEWYANNKGLFNVDIIVWEKKDWVQIADFFKRMKARKPDNQAVTDALTHSKYYKKIFLAKIINPPIS